MFLTFKIFCNNICINILKAALFFKTKNKNFLAAKLFNLLLFKFLEMMVW